MKIFWHDCFRYFNSIRCEARIPAIDTILILKYYYRVTSLDHMLDALNNLHPIVFGLEVYSGFEKLETSKDHILSMPNPAQPPLGGHAMCMVGYDLPRGLILARNSFGPYWAMNGYCWIPFDYIKQETFDSWIDRKSVV